MTPNTTERATCTVTEAAEKLGIGRNQAYAAVKRGDLPTMKMGKRILVLVKPLNRMLNGEEA